MRPDESDDLPEEVKDYVKGLYPQDKEWVKAYLCKMLSAHLRVNHLGEKGELPPEQVTREHLERIFPDEERAKAYLVALMDREIGQQIRELEAEKMMIARGAVDPFSKTGKAHLALLNETWGDAKIDANSNPHERDAKWGVYTVRFGDENDTFDTWANAELTRVKMQNIIRDLPPASNDSVKSIKARSHPEIRKSRTSLRTWILVSAMVSQAKKSMTAKDLAGMGMSSSTATRMLHQLRETIVYEAKRDINSIRQFQGNYCYIDGIEGDLKLCYKIIGKNDVIKHRHDMVLRGIGNMVIREGQGLNVVFDVEPTLVKGESSNPVLSSFRNWVSPHRNKNGIDNLELYLYEFAYRYNADKRRLLGWSLINRMLRTVFAVNKSDLVKKNSDLCVNVAVDGPVGEMLDNRFGDFVWNNWADD